MSVERLFSYGTLQQAHVQLANFQRVLTGRPDTLVGYCLDLVEITDPAVLAQSGVAFHPILRFSGDESDRVEGIIFELTPLELEQADRYEVDDYQRVEVTLTSGLLAYVFVGRDRDANR